MKKVLGKTRKTKTLLDVVNDNRGIMISGRVIPPLVFEYLRAHPEEKMYIDKNKNNVQSIMVRAIKWDKLRNK